MRRHVCYVRVLMCACGMGVTTPWRRGQMRRRGKGVGPCSQRVHSQAVSAGLATSLLTDLTRCRCRCAPMYVLPCCPPPNAGTLQDHEVFQRVLQGIFGDTTFEEAYQRTGGSRGGRLVGWQGWRQGPACRQYHIAGFCMEVAGTGGAGAALERRSRRGL